MDERHWPTATDPLALLAHLFPVRGLDSAEPQTRKSRRYLFGCARRAWDRLPGVCRVVVGLAERVYGGPVTDRRLRDEVYPFAEALTHCGGESGGVAEIGRGLVALGHAKPEDVRAGKDHDPESWSGFAHLAYFPFSRVTPHYPRVPAELHDAGLVREVFGNPFGPRLFDARWRTTEARLLAQHADATADYSLLPVLADALEDAGCDRRDVLDHLRHGGPHAPGCWAVGLVLGE